MYGIEHFWVFLLAGILLNLTPGQDSMYIIGRSLAQGRKAGMAAAFGIGAGSVIHTLAAAYGLSFVLVNSALAFEIIRYAGAAYLVFLGLKLMFTKGREFMAPVHGKSHFGTGMLTNVLNPKVALFYLSFLPQFVDPGNTHGALPFVLLGLTFVLTGTAWCLALAWGASRFSHTLRRRPAWRRGMEKTSGMVFVLLGLRVAMQERV